MTKSEPIDVTPETQTQQPSQALQRIESGAVGRALSIQELHERLEYVREVMRREMREGHDYGKIPGTGEKPTLLQPGAQTLMLTFNLTEQVRKEVLREYPNWHREYEFTIAVKAPNGKEWDGVGTCSTLESKYRYRKVERQCPTCGKHSIIKGKEEYGGGWVCFKKKGGCGAKFAHNDQQITSQPDGKTENPDIADTWNTVRKMAFKRALVAAAINATNTSALWTQDLEEGGEDMAPSDAGASPPAPTDPNPKPATKPPIATDQPKYATEATRKWMIGELASMADLALEFMRKCPWPQSPPLMDNEGLNETPLKYVPINRPQMKQLQDAITAFGNGEDAKMPYPTNPLAPVTPEPKPEKKKGSPAKPVEVPRDPDAGKDSPEETPEIDPAWQVVTGNIQHISLKEGTSAKGPWSLWGIKLGDEWYNTFSNRVGQAAQAAYKTQREVELYYEEDHEGRFTAMEIK